MLTTIVWTFGGLVIGFLLMEVWLFYTANESAMRLRNAAEGTAETLRQKVDELKLQINNLESETETQKQHIKDLEGRAKAGAAQRERLQKFREAIAALHINFRE